MSSSIADTADGAPPFALRTMYYIDKGIGKQCHLRYFVVFLSMPCYLALEIFIEPFSLIHPRQLIIDMSNLSHREFQTMR